MSRVVYTEFRSTSDQEALRQTHQVRIVAGDEEGTGVNALPSGVYGYSPGLASSPLFSVRRYRSYETHKLPSGEIYIIGFATADDARALSTATAEMTIQIHPQPEGTHDVLVTIPYSAIRRHRQYAAPNQEGFTVKVMPL